MTFDEWWETSDNEYSDEKNLAKDVWQAATLAEREACAKVCDEKAAKLYPHAKAPYLDCSDAIRARGAK